MDDLLAEFLAETRETLDALSGEIIAWEADPSDRGRLDAIFRFVHTVKGSCGFLDLPRFETLSHAAEDVLAELRSGTRTADAALVSAVLAIIDRIGELTEALESGAELPSGDDGLLIAALSAEANVCPITGAAPHVVQTANKAPARSIRVPLELLDRMMSGVSDMVLARNELARRLREVGAEQEVGGAFERLSTCLADMRDSITRTRMQRIEKLFSALPRMVRDTSAELGKTVDLDIDGSDVELDREMIELMRDPLTHMVRNSIDHGIENAEVRRKRGKPEAGRLSISARQSGNQIVIEIADDGNGIDEGRLVAKAIANGVITQELANALPPAARAALIFSPGVSTAEQVTAISGRGVGMDVVKSNIERIGGSIELDNRPGFGLRTTIRVPLTLTIIASLTVSAGSQSFAIPRSAIEEIVHVSSASIRIDTLGDATVATIRGRALPLLHLEHVLGTGHVDEVTGRTIVVVSAGAGLSYALCVQAVHDHEELVIKPASPAVMGAGVYGGMSLPDSGVPMLMLDAVGIAARAGIEPEEANPIAALTQDAAAETGPELTSTLLFHDLAGRRRGIRLGVVERLEDVAADRIAETAGRLRVAIDGRLLPLLGCEEGLPAGAMVKLLRLSDGASELAFAIDDVIDIVQLPPAMHHATSEGPIAGVALVQGEQVELIDVFWLFAQADAAPVREERPLCLLADAEDRWSREILRPLLEAAGYRVGFAGESVEAQADVVIAGGEPVAAGAAPVIRLRPDMAGANDGSVYRYDRMGLLAAIESQVAKRRA
ncbi:chemotaxis protein CheA [Sphingomonas sp. MAH-20]|uniref:Chemotaxis protein CheA n=1 Tax=Sphingomonas horti TaxID=2682842 RepID=A0A6I4IYL5_9SPHN|nr:MULTISPECIES: chemotaxis protein CheW [Sphingomonas]MBA2920297.1 chemotaxis protein CheW [Sphingomonas sp. CGMCC 1.13658]MVO76551.1 chemotaxis protein CheA [Sphingomonas horti]